MEQWITALLLLGALMIVYRLAISILMRKKMVEGFEKELLLEALEKWLKVL